jgi:nucleoside-diphosphate-sugar epimerase
MKVVLTGYTGFIGSILYQKLLDLGYTVIGLDIQTGNNILDCKLPDCDLVIHLAAKTGVRDSLKYPKEYWETNVNGTKRILERYNNIRVLVAGSSSQYEPHLNPYAATKHVIEKIPHPNVCFMRFHTVYSSSPRPEMFFDKLLNNSLEYITNHERDFIHIDDLCNAVVLILKSDIVGPIDVGSGVSVKIEEICPSLPITNVTPFERKKTLANITKLKSLGFTATQHVLDFVNNLPSNIRR